MMHIVHQNFNVFGPLMIQSIVNKFNGTIVDRIFIMGRFANFLFKSFEAYDKVLKL